MDKIVDINICTGCHACYNICPQNCIEMVENKEGFLEPSINYDICINCNLCKKICPVNKDHKVTYRNVKAFVCINKNEVIRQNSSSGGIFTELASYILDQEGFVYGAAFDENFKVKHIKIEKKMDICKLQCSKYVQSNIGNIFINVKDDLEIGKKVLFTGTPCQIEGLLNFLGKEYSNLYTQDLICHGVPSPKSWNKYIREFGKGINSISFRDKTYGWKKFSMKVETDDSIYINTLDKDSFLQSFLKNINLRKSCYNCKFKTIGRRSDITLADYWGIEHIDGLYFDDKGTSLVIINSDKGQEMYDNIRKNLISKSTDLNKAIKYNPAINQSVELTKKRSLFFKNINKYTYEQLVKNTLKVTIIDKLVKIKIKIIRKIKRMLKL